MSHADPWFQFHCKWFSKVIEFGVSRSDTSLGQIASIVIPDRVSLPFSFFLLCEQICRYPSCFLCHLSKLFFFSLLCVSHYFMEDQFYKITINYKLQLKLKYPNIVEFLLLETNINWILHIINKIINLINSIANIIGMKLYQSIRSSRTISPCLISEIKVIRLKKNCINLLTNFILDFNRTGLFICSFERRPSRFLSPYRVAS